MPRESAAAVGALLEAQLATDSLDGTPLSLLPAFAQKLRAAAVRKRAFDKLWTLTKAEALAGFYDLQLFLRPDVPADTLASRSLAH